MTFEKDFPGLMTCEEGTTVQEDIQKHCLDKQKVKDTIKLIEEMCCISPKGITCSKRKELPVGPCPRCQITNEISKRLNL